MHVKLEAILKAILFTANKPLTEKLLQRFFSESERPTLKMIRAALLEIEKAFQDEVIQLRKLASGYVLQVRETFSPWVSRLLEEKPARYSRALLETLSIIAYRQTITRAEIESIRGVAVATSMIRILEDRAWIRVIGHRDLPGKPDIYGTTASFLDYFNCETLSDLPPIGDCDALREASIQRMTALISDETNACSVHELTHIQSNVSHQSESVEASEIVLE